MKKQFKHIILCSIITGCLFSCKKDYTNPGAVAFNQAFSSPQAMADVATGLQRAYTLGRASSLYNKITLDGLLTNQLTVLNQGNTSEYQLQLGGNNVDGTNTILGGLWTNSNKIIFDANNILGGVANLGDKNFASGIQAYAAIFKALALGDLAMYWEKVPASIGTNVTFVDRLQNYGKAIATLDSAITAVNAFPVSASFYSYVPSGIDIINTLHALKARYALFSGNYPLALTEANLVDLKKTSAFTFLPAIPNPIYDVAGSNVNVYAVSGTTMGLPAGLQPDPNDKRVPFYITAASPRIGGFGSGSSVSWPIYLPGEITLIKAEAYARMNPPDLNNALIELNKVVTKQPSADPFGVGAGLPSLTGPYTQQQLLDLIYQQRSIELFMSGLRLEDMRRFGRPNSEKKRNFLPYPFQERDNNPNTPPDPAF